MHNLYILYEAKPARCETNPFMECITSASSSKTGFPRRHIAIIVLAQTYSYPTQNFEANDNVSRSQRKHMGVVAVSWQNTSFGKKYSRTALAPSTARSTPLLPGPFKQSQQHAMVPFDITNQHAAVLLKSRHGVPSLVTEQTSSASREQTRQPCPQKTPGTRGGGAGGAVAVLRNRLATLRFYEVHEVRL
jgi:hypothetical protein